MALAAARGLGLRVWSCGPWRGLASSREVLDYDVCVVGAGPAGLAAAIRLRQLAPRRGKEPPSVCVLEKGHEVGAHVLSGNVLEPRALDELLPSWRDDGAPVGPAVTSDAFYYLTESGAVRLPTPPQMHNAGNHVASLSQLARWLGEKAEELGVEVFPGIAASELLYDEHGTVAGVATGDVGVAKDGSHKESFARGVELRAKVTILAEGCRGSLSQLAMERFGLRDGADPQTYALGIKEVWEVAPQKHSPGTVWHSVGWPLDSGTYGGSFLYHMDENRVALGFVVGLDYKNPYLSPYEEFQRFKQHPAVRPLLEGGSVLQYGARTLNEGGLQSVPRLEFPGGALVGCAAGFLNVPKIKGTHTAMKSGMLAAEAALDALEADAGTGDPLNLDGYEAALKASWVWEELSRERNVRPGFARWGLWGGIANAALEAYVLRGNAPWTLRHAHPDHTALEPAERHAPIAYPRADGEVSFDILDSVSRSSTNHDHDQPTHLRLRDPAVARAVNLARFAGPEGRYCPAKVYEWVEGDDGQQSLAINAQNCLHCKACDIKDPTQNIQWTAPEGGGGPGYTLT